MVALLHRQNCELCEAKNLIWVPQLDRKELTGKTWQPRSASIGPQYPLRPAKGRQMTGVAPWEIAFY
jgi:hypothetical protein